MTATNDSTPTPRTLEERLNASAEAWRSEQGDKMLGTVVDLDTRDSEYGTPYPIVTVLVEGGTSTEKGGTPIQAGVERAWHAFHTVARNELKKQRPQVGDRIGVVDNGISEPKAAGMSGAHLYKVVVERDEKPATVDWSAMAGDGEEEEVGEDDLPF